LESQLLVVTSEKMWDVLDNSEEYKRKFRAGEWQPILESIDPELEELPTALCRGNDLLTEWTYLIDLDSELFLSTIGLPSICGIFHAIVGYKLSQ
jgi:hypothetical protein